MGTRTHRLLLAGLVCAGCASDEDIGESQHETHLPIDNYTWLASHNTYDRYNTPTGEDITWHFTAPTPTMHIEVDIRDTVTAGRPSGWDATLTGHWWVAHDEDGPVTVHCGTVGRFADCLNFIKTYHNNNLTHAFISVWVDKKNDWESLLASTTARSPWNFDYQISSRFSADTLYTPSDVLGDGQGTLRYIIEHDGWRSPDLLQGKIMFVLTSDVNYAGNERLEQYVQNRGVNAKAFVATPGSSQSQIVDGPSGFSATNSEWVVVYNFEWSSSIYDGECNSQSCEWLYEAVNHHFLTRTWDLDDYDEDAAANTAGANFRPVNCPWKSITNNDRYDCGL